MKKLVFILLLVLSNLALAESLSVFLSDEDEKPTDLFNKPNGEVIYQLKGNDKSAYAIELAACKDEWCKIEAIYDYDQPEGKNEVKINSPEVWIATEFLGLCSRNYGGQELKLYLEPSEKSAVAHSFKEELCFEPLDFKKINNQLWVKVRNVENKNQSGWILDEWLCNSARTTCP